MNSKEDVVIGWAEPVEEEETIKLEELESKIGGSPLWLGETDAAGLPELKCEICSEKLKFLCQNLKECAKRSEGIKVFRAQLPEKNDILEYDSKQDKTLNKIPSTVEIDPETILTKKEWYIDTDIQPADVQQEILDAEEFEDEADEEDIEAELRDDSFKFYKRFDKTSPAHVLRYCFSKDTKPLFYTDYDQFEPDCKVACEHCGANRIFEFQLNSQLLSFIEELREFDWGIVAFYTCSKSCTAPSKYTKEIVKLQLAPDELDRLNMKRLQDRQMKEFQADFDGDDDGEFEMPTEEEIKRVKQQIKNEEKEDYEPMKASKRKPKEEVMEEKTGEKKLFASEGSEDEEWG